MKEFEVTSSGYIGSFIEERADNDGDNLRKNVSLGVQDNNVYIINPITGLLESRIRDVVDETPDETQFTLTNPTSSISVFVIKNIGKSIKVTNVTNTEVCINQNISGSNYVYDGISFPSGSLSCQKNIYFTSNENIIWPRQQETQTVLNDLSKKIPYDIGFSQKYYKLHYLTDEQLLKLEKETRISIDFLKTLPVLFLFDTEYPDQIEFSSIKISNEWDGYSIDINDRNNLVYSDFYKNTNAEYTPFVFLVPNLMLQHLEEYFEEMSNQKIPPTDVVTKFNPIPWINEKRKEKEKYGKTYNFMFDTINENDQFKLMEESILDILLNEEIYKIDPAVTDIELVEDVVASDFFLEIVNGDNKFFTINNTDINIDGTSVDNGGGETDTIEDQQTILTLFFQDRSNFLEKLLVDKHSKISNKNNNISIKVIKLLMDYVDFQLKNSLPNRENVVFNLDVFNSIVHSEKFVLSDFSNPEIDTNNVFYVVSRDSNGNINVIDQINNTEPIDTLLDNQSIQNVYETSPFITIDIPPIDENSIYSYKQLISTNADIKYSDKYYVTKPLFNINNDRCNSFFTSSVIDNHKKYYMSITTKNSIDNNFSKVFDISYAHKDGLGSTFVKENTELYPAKVMYKKYMADCFGNADVLTFKSGKTSDYFYIIEFDRNSFKDRLDNTTLQISLSPLSSSSNQLVNTGSNVTSNQNSNKIFTLIDDSRITKTYNDITYDINEYYSLVEGTIQQGLSEDEELDIWGLVFPNKGLILLDGKTLDYSCSFNTVTASIDGDNINKLFLSISGSLSPNNVRTNHEYWYCRSAELYSDLNFFCRIYKNQFNYTNNYTYISGSDRKFYYDVVNATSKTYITTIGLYNDARELLAVAKLRKPLLKDSGHEYIFNIKIRTN